MWFTNKLLYSSKIVNMSHDLEKYFQVAVNLTREAGKIIRERIWENKAVLTKASEIDFVTETDQQVEKLLIGELSLNFPEHKFIAEEATAAGAKVELTDSPTWIIDPVDGTMNFVHGYPNCCVSIALLIDKVAKIGIVYNPVTEQLFSACQGQGAYLNDNRIKVSNKTDISEALLCIEFGSSRDPEKMKVILENINNLYPVSHGIRSAGSAALNMAMVALGGIDAYYEFGIHAWDMAAGDLLVREAGGVVIDPAGGPFDLLSCRMLCASTPELARQLSEKLAQFYPKRDA